MGIQKPAPRQDSGGHQSESDRVPKKSGFTGILDVRMAPFNHRWIVAS